jgi:general secretion pathway protein I
MNGARGFTLLEVMISLAILGLALTAIVDINGTAIRTHSYSKQVTIATMLARSKMADLESQFVQEGFTSEFDQKMEGNFEDEGWESFAWEAEIIKPDLDAQNATALVEQLVGKVLGTLGEDAEGTAPAAPDTPTIAPEGMLAAVRPMMQAQITQLTETLKSALREVRLKVKWEDGGSEESVDVVTHLVILAPAGQGPPGQVPAPALMEDGGLPPGINFPGIPPGLGATPPPQRPSTGGEP